MTTDDPTLGILAAAITDLTQKVDTIQSRVAQGDPTGHPSGHLEGRLRTIESLLAEVRKAVVSLAQTKARDDAQRAMRLPWHTLTTAEAEQRWLELRDWVTWFLVRNDIGPKDIPHCWYRHSGLVDELEALQWAWIDSNNAQSKGNDPIAWRDALNRARPRWPLFNPNGCASAHTETHPRAAGAEQQWEYFLAVELANQSGAPAS